MSYEYKPSFFFRINKSIRVKCLSYSDKLMKMRKYTN